MEFRGAEFSVRAEMEEELLVVEISDSLTADQWRGEFDPAYIEDLTRKTGNFKQFPIFCSMLESAISKTSEAVTLDLLTYADLELLRNRKTGLSSKARPHSLSSAISAKRYLILIYTVEFDRIHYPLPLPYLGKPDPAVLQREIQALRAELAALRTQGGRNVQDPETSRLRAELARVRGEKESLAQALERLQAVGVDRTPDAGARGLREVIQSLEEQLLRERAKNQRSASKRSQERRLLLDQLEDLRASERALRIRVKSLTNELALLQRGRASPLAFRRSSSRGEYDVVGPRSVSRERSLGGGMRARSGSRERTDDRDRGQRAGSTGTRPRVPRPSPSPTGSRAQRFDPTGYVLERQRRQKEAEIKNQRKIKRDMLTPPTNMERGRSRSREIRPQFARLGSGGRGRSSSAESRRSRRFSDNSLVELEELSKPIPSRTRKASCNSSSIHTVPRGRHSTKKPLCSTPTHSTRAVDKESADLSEIDARLQALQEYMRDLDTGR
ncbi:coiled-coil domain-containing protein 61-like [Scleropages formosus]|uniref:Centrosomal protein CCDC61 n=1 Tax=Scleropages formosus TaxID=113540 RepID=A0A0P7UVD5_SCLFO|nr:coiled-coil domain-containing protein 61-like [Scleropages formosus]